ncbi:MAG: FAD-dependent oxidoreductase [Planctomycetes bacterium]|nr:FAD-dependent oxidoreductase [Planctomycetota bacterium]
MRIAVVGAGVSGLVAAWILSRRHQVELFESDARLGGHVHTHSVDDRGTRRAVDSGFIVFNRRTYPHFTRLLEHLGVDARATSMSFSVRSERTGLEYNGTSLNALFAQRTNLLRPSFHRMIRDIVRFNRRAKELAANGREECTLGTLIDDGGYGREFVEHYLVPMGSAVWSTEPARMQEFPALFFARFFANHGFLEIDDRPQWYTVRGGSYRYVEKLLAEFSARGGRVRSATPIERVERVESVGRVGRVGHVGRDAGASRDAAVLVRPRGGEPERFDHVVLAAHADQTLAMLADPSDAERELLGAFPFTKNDAVLHTDAGLLPKRKLARASWNYHLPKDPNGRATVTYWMNLLQGLDTPTTYCVTLNHAGAIAPEHVLARMQYAHPLYQVGSVTAQARVGEIQGARNTWFAGAYWRNGFHEDGVASALAVARGFGLELLP